MRITVWTPRLDSDLSYGWTQGLCYQVMAQSILSTPTKGQDQMRDLAEVGLVLCEKLVYTYRALKLADEHVSI
jgi:hypothetical protein